MREVLSEIEQQTNAHERHPPFEFLRADEARARHCVDAAVFDAFSCGAAMPRRLFAAVLAVRAPARGHEATLSAPSARRRRSGTCSR